MTTDLMDQYFNGAVFYLVSMDATRCVTKHNLPRRTIKDVGALFLTKTHLCYPEHQIFYETDTTIKDLFGDQIDNIMLSNEQHQNKGYLVKIISFVERSKNEEK